MEGFYALLALLGEFADGCDQVAAVELLLTLLLDLVPFHVPQLLKKLGLVHIHFIQVHELIRHAVRPQLPHEHHSLDIFLRDVHNLRIDPFM